MKSENYVQLSKTILFFIFFQFLFSPTQAQDNTLLKFDLIYTGKDPIILSNYKVETGDSIFISAEGKIVVGPFAGDRDADGEPSYGFGFYNIITQWPHAIMMAGISNRPNSITVLKQDWLKCGSKFQFKAAQTGYLCFQINEQKLYSITNRPVEKGIIIHINIKTTKEYIGKIKDKTVSRKADKIYWGDNEVRRDVIDGLYHFKEGSGKEAGIYDEKHAPHLFEYIDSYQEIPLYFNADEGIVYFGKKFISRGDDAYWQLTDEKQKKIGIFTEEVPYFYEEIGVLDKHQVFANWQRQLVLYQNSKIQAESNANIWIVKDFLGDSIGLVHRTAPHVYQKIGRFPVHEDQALRAKVYYNPQSLILWCDQTLVQKSADGLWYFQDIGICQEGKLFDYIGEICNSKVYKTHTEVFFRNQLIQAGTDGNWHLEKDDPNCIVKPIRPFIVK